MDPARTDFDALTALPLLRTLDGCNGADMSTTALKHLRVPPIREARDVQRTPRPRSEHSFSFYMSIPLLRVNATRGNLVLAWQQRVFVFPTTSSSPKDQIAWKVQSS